MYQHQLPNLRELTQQLEDEYIDFLAQTHPEAFDIDVMDDDPQHPVTETVLNDQYRVSTDEMAQTLGYDDFAAFMALELLKYGVTQSAWVKQWSREVLNRTQGAV